MASLSKMFAATATYPYQVVRSRLQVRNEQRLFDAHTTGRPKRSGSRHVLYTAVSTKVFEDNVRDNVERSYGLWGFVAP